jgi:predicted DsbA family dithiol-disulfide isomerase
MVIHIWSDIACPFCYIGKRHLEAALEQFDGSQEVQLLWHSFQLDPDLVSTGNNYLESLAARKGWSREQVRDIVQHVTEMAAQTGLHYDFEKMIEANTFLAHQAIHLAASFSVQTAMKERLLSAHFLEGRDVGDLETIVAIGGQISIPEQRMREALRQNEFGDAVKRDMELAQKMGIRGVPFFLFENRVTLSGAQPVAAFLDALRRASEG